MKGGNKFMVNYCPECGCKVDSDEGYCPKCGSKLGNYKIVNNEKSSSIPKNKKIIILFLMLHFSYFLTIVFVVSIMAVCYNINFRACIGL